MKSEDLINYAKIAGILAGVYIGYRTIKSAGDAYKDAGDLADSVTKGLKEAGRAAVEVVTEKLNPASNKNIVYGSLPETWKEKLMNVWEKILGTPESSAQISIPSVDVTILDPRDAAVKNAETVKNEEERLNNEIELLDRKQMMKRYLP